MDLINNFSEIVNIIEMARNNAIKKVNEELILLYWNIGQYISRKVASAEWGDGIIDELASFIKINYPTIKGFNRRGLYRMKQFYETYKDNKFVSTLLTQISWSNHLHILSKTKTMAEKEFYLTLCVKEKYSSRELERQVNSAYYERYMLSTQKISPAVQEFNKKTRNTFLDSYVLEFLDLPEKVSEQDLKKAIIHNLKNFILEIGKDFTFVGEEYRVQVGTKDFYIDYSFTIEDYLVWLLLNLKVMIFLRNISAK